MTNLQPPAKVTATYTATAKAKTASTQEAYPWKATLRTAVAVLTAVVIAVPSVLGIVVSTFDVYLSAEAIATITAISTFTVTLGLFFTRLMAVPGVNEFLKKLGLGATPKGE